MIVSLTSATAFAGLALAGAANANCDFDTGRTLKPFVSVGVGIGLPCSKAALAARTTAKEPDTTSQLGGGR